MTRHSNRVGIRTCSDYSPFGVELDGRTVSGGYRYGFSGKEKTDEIQGVGNSYDFGARIYDPIISRWLSCDPFESKNANQSPYVCADNNPIYFNDPDGKDAVGTIKGNTITVSAKLLVYNENQNKIDIVKMQKAINKYYGPKSVVIDGKRYNVKFDIQVKEITKNDLKNKTQPGENYVYPMSENYRSEVTDKKYGKFASNQYDNATYAHEVGHFFGLGDQYYEYKAKGVSPVNGLKDKNTYVENLPNNSRNELMGKACVDPDVNAELSNKDVIAIAKFVLNNNKNGIAIISQKNIWEYSNHRSTALRRREGDTFEIDYNLGNLNYEIITHDKTTESQKTKKKPNKQ